MKRGYRFFAAVFAFALVLAAGWLLAAPAAQAASSGNCGKDGANVTWTLDDQGLLTIRGTGEMKNYSSTGPWGKGVKKVDIESGVTSIGKCAFYSCKSLMKITIPESVTSIGNNALTECSSLTSIAIPESVTSISDYAFSGCSNLESISIPDSVTSIGMSAFQGCSGLVRVMIPQRVTSISEYAFYDCNNLTSITIPDVVTSIGEYAFSGCSGLENVTIPESVTIIGRGAFNGCSGLTSITISEGVTSIGEYAFSGCSGLESVTIPKSVTSIDNSAFSGCGSLASVTIPDGVTSIGDGLFHDCENLTSVTIPDGVTSIGASMFHGCSSLTSVTIPDSVTSIGDYAFEYCNSLTSVTIPDSVTSIGGYVFYDCSSLTSITTPNSVTSIGAYAFSGCRSLTSITIQDGVTSIGDHAFLYCSSLESITIPKGVTSIGDSTFYGCSSLTSVTIPDSVTSIGKSAFAAFEGRSSLKLIDLPDNIMSIGDQAFSGFTGYVYANMGSETAKTLSRDGKGYFCVAGTGCGLRYSFSNNEVVGLRLIGVEKGTTAVDIPDGVTAIDGETFKRYFASTNAYNEVEKIIIPRSVETIDSFVKPSATVYCYKYSEADYKAQDNGNTIVYLDSFSNWNAIRELTLSDTALRLACGETRKVYQHVFPNNDHPTVTWTSTDPDVASVDADGRITALKPGVATITARVGSASASVQVTCYARATGFELPERMGAFAQENTPVPVVKIVPEGADISLSWSSADEKLATVDENGNVYGRKPGNEVTITATTDDGIERSCVVRILPAREDLDILELPADLAAIGEEAFAGAACQCVVVPDGCESIGPRAFANCPNLMYVRIPASVKTVAEDAFEGCGDVWIDQPGE